VIYLPEEGDLIRDPGDASKVCLVLEAIRDPGSHFYILSILTSKGEKTWRTEATAKLSCVQKRAC